MLIYNGQIIAGGGTIVLPMTRAEYEANKAILDSADVWVDLTDEPDAIATADQIAYSVDNVQKGMNYIGDIATKAVAKVEPTDTALYLHEVGEYFINKDGNACKVDTQISVGGTITLGANCHVLSKGVANDINSNLTWKFKGNLADRSATLDVSTAQEVSLVSKYGNQRVSVQIPTLAFDGEYINFGAESISVAVQLNANKSVRFQNYFYNGTDEIGNGASLDVYWR